MFFPSIYLRRVKMRKLLIAVLLLLTVAAGAQEINIGAYWPLHNNGIANFQAMRNMGFNHCWYEYDYNLQLTADDYIRAGFKLNMLLRINKHYRDADLTDMMDSVSPGYRNRVLSVHLGDEPLRNYVRYPLADLQRSAAMVRRSRYPVAINYGLDIHRDHQRYPEWLRKHFATFDKISIDLYTQHHGNHRIYGGKQNFIPYSIELIRQYEPKKPVWIILQGISDNCDKYADLFARELRLSEFRYQTWISLMHGVEGVSYWWPADSNGNQRTLAKIKIVVDEVRALQRAFLAPVVKQRINGVNEYFHPWEWDKTKPMPIESRNKLEYRVTKYRNAYWIFIANNASHGIMFKQRVSKWLSQPASKWNVLEYDWGKPVADSRDYVRVLERWVPAKTIRVYRVMK